MCRKPNRDAAMTEVNTTKREPRDFLDPATTPLATWAVRELCDALGVAKVAELWETTSGNARQVRWRGTATVERMQVLQDAIKQDEQRYREALVTIYTTGAFRRQA
ncbi:hypothetical protein KEM14_gp19 [Xanthomonas virus phiXaf18]|uniref:Uncharacterized protein n=1 Tax=Xanthomonas virus phiXaf18 TaxID=2653651 RepID=A0A5P8PS03_9CAUD|nr:hypothetical protein KEM14_gp19 [Xanthomonas virus phiXaf18]QFR59581.1 hypothetical protein phiXaf18_19 [Xanthomonas virus phiXaf18]